MDDFPEFITILDEKNEHFTHGLYETIIRSALKKILPDNFFGQPTSILDQLPLVKAHACPLAPGNISFFCLSLHRPNGFKFFLDLISNWPLSGKKLNLGMIYSVDFRIPELGNDTFTLCEVMTKVDNLTEFEQMCRDFPLIENDAKKGLSSSSYARRILEIRGLTPDQKTAMIQERMAALVNRVPQIFDGDLFSEMQHVLTICGEDFKSQRCVSHLSRLIGIHYLFRKRLLSNDLSKRHLHVKIIGLPSDPKKVLGITVGLNFLRETEVFEQKHLLSAILQYVPTAEVIDESFFANRRGSEQICTVYLEIKKSDNQEFSSEEIASLRRKLPDDIKNHIGRLTLPVFMPPNEEEIMRNILALSKQIKYLRDIPQVIISFEEQTDHNLIFRIIYVRLLLDGKKSLQLNDRSTFLRFIPERTKVVGYLRKKYVKEATVFRVKFAKDSFLRGDHSIDLYKARQALVNELNRLFGEFRDFNGGMIAKQNELLTEVKTYLTKEGESYNELLLENFFYSLAPVIMRTVLEPHAFKELFGMLVESVDRGVPSGHRYSLKMKTDPEFCFVMMQAANSNVLDEISKAISRQQFQSSELAQGYVRTPESICMGFIYRSNDSQKQLRFQNILESAAENLVLRNR